jgi:phage terminase small subunit
MALTIKQEKFCMVYVETGNASEAYRQAYNAENMSNEAIGVEACRLLDHPSVALKVKELKSGHIKRHELTIDDLVAELEEARQAALSAMVVQSSASVAATMGKAKLLGLVVDKTDIKLTSAKELTNEQLAVIAAGGSI